MEGSSCPARKRPATGSNNGVKPLCPRKRLLYARTWFGENHQRWENDKKQDPRRTTTPTRQRSQRCKTRTANTHRTETRYLGPTRTNNIRHYTTSTAEPRHNMGRAEHRQVQASKRVPRSLDHSGPDERAGPDRWPGLNISTGASATSNSSSLAPVESCGDQLHCKIVRLNLTLLRRVDFYIFSTWINSEHSSKNHAVRKRQSLIRSISTTLWVFVVEGVLFSRFGK